MTWKYQTWCQNQVGFLTAHVQIICISIDVKLHKRCLLSMSTDYADGQSVKTRMFSRAALTHRLKKMKSKMAKCKQCDNYIVVSGVECEEV